MLRGQAEYWVPRLERYRERLSPCRSRPAADLLGADSEMHDTIVASARTLKNKALSLGQQIADVSLYGNYAISDTPVESIYGPDHLARMRDTRSRIDPQGVMSLAGGWKV